MGAQRYRGCVAFALLMAASSLSTTVFIGAFGCSSELRKLRAFRVQHFAVGMRLQRRVSDRSVILNVARGVLNRRANQAFDGFIAPPRIGEESGSRSFRVDLNNPHLVPAVDD